MTIELWNCNWEKSAWFTNMVWEMHQSQFTSYSIPGLILKNQFFRALLKHNIFGGRGIIIRNEYVSISFQQALQRHFRWSLGGIKFWMNTGFDLFQEGQLPIPICRMIKSWFMYKICHIEYVFLPLWKYE